MELKGLGSTTLLKVELAGAMARGDGTGGNTYGSLIVFAMLSVVKLPVGVRAESSTLRSIVNLLMPGNPVKIHAARGMEIRKAS